MKIAFITSSLEPGKSGISDYTRLLAQECVRQGQRCVLIALNDPYLSETQDSESGTNCADISALRLPSQVSWRKRIEKARDRLDTFQPDRVSLQFSYYGFHETGIMLEPGKWLKRLLREHSLHIMFHELWLSAFMSSRPQNPAMLKKQLLGEVQRFFIIRMIRQLRPLVMHTSNPTFVAVLRHHGVPVERLPLFGNIPPVNGRSDGEWLFRKLRKAGLAMDTENRERFWLFGFFGSLYSVWPPEPLFTYIHRASVQHGRKAVMISIGRPGEGESLWASLSPRYSDRFSFLTLGEQSPERISEALRSMDFGIAASPCSLIGKSSSATTMLEHGLPVIVNRDDVRWSVESALSCPSEPLLYKMDAQLPEKIGKMTKSVPYSRLEKVTAQFLRDLTEAGQGNGGSARSSGKVIQP